MNGSREVNQKAGQSMNAQMELKSEPHHVNHQDIKGIVEPMDKHSPYPTHYEYIASLLGLLIRPIVYPHYIYPAQPGRVGQLCSLHSHIQAKDNSSAKFEAWNLLLGPMALLSTEHGEVQEDSQGLSAEKSLPEMSFPAASKTKSLVVSVKLLNIEGLQFDSSDSGEKKGRIQEISHMSSEASNASLSHLLVSVSKHCIEHRQSQVENQGLSVEAPLPPVLSARSFLTGACVKSVSAEGQKFSRTGSEEDTWERLKGISHPASQYKLVHQNQVDNFQHLEGNHLLIANSKCSRYLDPIGFSTPALIELDAVNKGRSSSDTQFHVITSSQSKNIPYVVASPAG